MFRSMRAISLCLLILSAALGAQPAFYAAVVITSSIDNLPLVINESPAGELVAGKPLEYRFKARHGSGSSGQHNITVQKPIDDEREYFLSMDIRFLASDLEHNRTRKIELLPPTVSLTGTHQKRVPIRTKPHVLRKQSGGLLDRKLAHNSAYHFAAGDRHLYVISQANDRLWSPSRREDQSGEFLEIFHAESLKPLAHIPLRDSLDRFGHFSAIGATATHLCLGTYTAEVLCAPKERLLEPGFTVADFSPLPVQGLSGNIVAIRSLGALLLVMDRHGSVAVLSGDSRYTLTPPQDRYRIEGVRTGVLRDAALIEDRLYLPNDTGTIFVYQLGPASAKHLKSIRTATFDPKRERHQAERISHLVPIGHKLYFSQYGKGIGAYDTRQESLLFSRKPIHPPKVHYSELLGREIETPPPVHISKMIAACGYLIFSESGSGDITVYDPASGKVRHTFAGGEGSVFGLAVIDSVLYSLSSKGRLYGWSLGVCPPLPKSRH